MISKLAGKIFKLIDKIEKFALKFDVLKSRFPEILTLIIYPILFCFFTCFHEPWFDEAQAWQIAKHASYQDILFYLPHLEGHPPFWHLLLSLFAKNNFPYEITIKTISFIFSYIAVILIVLKAPFLRIIRILLPYSYFLFYQFGIISRPYCFIMLAFILLAINYNKKNEKPLCYIFGLTLLGIVHPFTLIISGMLTFVWFIECIKNKMFFKRSNFLSFLVLAIFYIVVILFIFPSKEAFAMNFSYISSFWERLACTIFVLPSEAFISSLYGSIFSKIHFSNFIFGLFISCFIYFFIYFYAKENKIHFLTFLIPYIVFSVFATKYLYIQHVGIIFCFVLFIFWIIFDYRKKENIVFESEQINKFFIVFIVFSLFTGMYWNIKSCILDVFISYAKGKKEAQFIKENNLDKYKILAKWIDDEQGNDSNINLNFGGTWLAIAPYFDKKIFYNLNIDNPEMNYIIFRKINSDENVQIKNKIKEQGKPDVLLDNPSVEEIFDDIDTYKEYTTVYVNNHAYIHKGVPYTYNPTQIMVRKEIAEKLNLKESDVEFEEHNFSSLTKILSYFLIRIMNSNI